VQGQYFEEFEFQGQRYSARKTAEEARDAWVANSSDDLDRASARARYDAAVML
jgi:hypothetical protein